MMAGLSRKQDFPVNHIRRYLEPGLIVLVSSRWNDKINIMTLGGHVVLEFSPSLVGLMISSGNHSFQMIRESKQCIINLPTTKLVDTAVGIGNMSGLRTAQNNLMHAAVLQRASPPVRSASRRLRRRLEFRSASEAPQRAHAPRLRMQMVGFEPERFILNRLHQMPALNA